MSVEMDIEKYLLRIGHSPGAPVEPTLLALRYAHRGHLLCVPFENLSLHTGHRVRLEIPLLYDKIVNRRRGGFCFENNGLFSWLLSKMGFEVTLLSGQVRNSTTRRFGPPFDHLVSMVTLEGRRWLCDVGFGSSGFRFPLSLEDTDAPQRQGHRVYRIRTEGDVRFLEWQGDEDRGEKGEWTELYKFTLEPRCLEDFVEMCDYHQSSPSSIFYCKSLCSVFTQSGFVTYVGHKLTTTVFPEKEGGGAFKSTTMELKDEEIPAILEQHFGVVLDSPLVTKDEAITPPAAMY